MSNCFSWFSLVAAVNWKNIHWCTARFQVREEKFKKHLKNLSKNWRFVHKTYKINYTKTIKFITFNVGLILKESIRTPGSKWTRTTVIRIVPSGREEKGMTDCVLRSNLLFSVSLNSNETKKKTDFYHYFFRIRPPVGRRLRLTDEKVTSHEFGIHRPLRPPVVGEIHMVVQCS